MARFPALFPTSQNPDVIHGPFLPASVFAGMGVSATLDLHGREPVTLRVWRLSPQGIEFCHMPQMEFEVGQSVLFTLHLAGQSVHYTGVVVSPQHTEDGRALVGVTYEPKVRAERPINTKKESREQKRFTVDKNFYPTGIANSPLLFHDTILFTVRDLSGMGMRLNTSMRNKFLVPGFVLDAKMHFPPLAASQVKLLIRSVSVVQQNGDYSQSLGVRVIEHDEEFAPAVSQYIMQFGRAEEGVTAQDVKMLREKGANESDVVDWGFAEKTAHYQEVAALRQRVYGDETPSNVAKSAALDDRSRLLVGRYRGRIVASLRLIFSNGPKEPFEVQQYVSVPANYSNHLETAEMSLLCVDLDFGDKELAVDLMRFGIFVMLQAGRKYALTVTNDQLRPLFIKAGFIDTRIYLPQTAGGRAGWHMLSANVEDIVDGRGIGPVMWNKLFNGQQEHMHHERWRHMGRVGTARLATYRLLGPAGSLLGRWKKP